MQASPRSSLTCQALAQLPGSCHSPAPARFPRMARGQAPRARPGASLGGKGFRGKKNNFPRLSCAALGFLLTFLGYILLFRVTQSSLLKCYVCLAESARLSPGLSRWGWMYMNLDFVPPNEEKLVLKLSSDSALMGVLTYLHFFQPLKKKEKKILLIHSISKLDAPEIFFALVSPKLFFIQQNNNRIRVLSMIMLIFHLSVQAIMYK